MALGAAPAGIYRSVIARGLRLTAVGVAIGLAGAAVSGRLIESRLFGVTPADPLTYTSIVVVFAVVSAAACVVPARRALRVDPLLALRAE
jgi:ABC-type antimicrobial peptide transport system permease subunit